MFYAIARKYFIFSHYFLRGIHILWILQSVETTFWRKFLSIVRFQPFLVQESWKIFSATLPGYFYPPEDVLGLTEIVGRSKGEGWWGRKPWKLSKNFPGSQRICQRISKVSFYDFLGI